MSTESVNNHRKSPKPTQFQFSTSSSSPSRNPGNLSLTGDGLIGLMVSGLKTCRPDL